MKMQRWFVVLAVVLVALNACNTGGGGDFKTAKSGMGYKIISGKGKDSMKVGDLFRIRLIERYEDSLLTAVEESPDQFWKVDSAAGSFFVTEVLREMSVGDSVTCRIPVDSILKRSQGPAFPWMKAGKNIYVSAKIIKKFKTMEEGRAEYDAESKRIQELLPVLRQKEFDKIAKEKFVGALKTKSGTLVKITKQGDGAACDSGKLLSMRYEGRFTNGQVFDGNMKVDSLNPRPPFEFQLGVFPVINGWREGLSLLKKGSKASFLIHYNEAYGPMGDQRMIPGFANMLFDVEVVDVKDAPKQPAGAVPPPVR